MITPRPAPVPIRVPVAASLLRLAVCLAALALAGCGHLNLMKTPNLYLAAEKDPFAEVPEELRTPYMDVVFATDRFPEQERSNDPVTFGAERSSHLHVGTCRINVGRKTTWEQLEAGSRSSRRGSKFRLHIGEPDILMRYPGTFWRMARIDDPSRDFEDFTARRMEARARFHELLDRQLAHARRKEAFIFVHGYNNDFDDAVRTIGNLWHFMGREGIPIAYTWPAGAGGLTGYTTDRESCEFTIFHFKMFMEDLAAHPDVERIHILSHSRGTDVAVTTLRELAIAARAAGKDPRRELKVGNLILASPDIDMEVAAQRIASERVPEVVERMTIYLSPSDRALRLSSWLQGSWARLGLLDVNKITAAQLQVLAAFPNLDFIDSRVDSDFIGHGYFYNNPAVSSDVILILRDGRDPGAEHGRPLESLAPELWRIEDGYMLPSTDPLSRLSAKLK